MIDLENEQIVMFGQANKITSWVVMFQTPMGLFENINEAIEQCRNNDMDYLRVLSPVAVAVDSAGRYEVGGG